MNVPLLDLKAQYRAIRAEVEEAMREVMESQHFILGPVVEKCEARIAEYCGTRHAIGVSSGTDALLLCLMAEDIGPGDEVITTPYTFFATAGCVSRLGATPVFVDIDPVSYNLDSRALEARVTPRTRAIIPVHLFGQSADMRAVMDVAARHQLLVIEDAAQAIGAEDEMGRCGAIGDYGCLSFFPSKNLGAAGDGGMVVTSDAARAERLRVLRAHGSQPKYHHRLVGGNFRLDALQAAVVNAKLGHLDAWTKGRNENADRYNHLFAASGLKVLDSAGWARGERRADSSHAQVVLPSVVAPRHVFNQYVIRVPHRDAVRSDLQKRGIGTEVYYPVPMHLQECFASLGHKRGDFPESESAADGTLALPIYPELSDEQAAWVVRSVAEAVRQALARLGGGA